jgi:hypothetical protein
MAMESLFESSGNRLLQQNRPKTDVAQIIFLIKITPEHHASAPRLPLPAAVLSCEAARHRMSGPGYKGIALLS